ncbi:MAG: SMC-Scp complex subunit ScpB [Nitrospinae bacterium]|nr:SMC-Scp complex subunit ScpB [Nitrospinota bacterium]
MNDPQLENQETGRMETGVPFELADDGASSPDAAAKALAEHQMEAMEEPRQQTLFEIEEPQEGVEFAEDATGEEEAGEVDKDAPLVMDLDETKKIIESILFVASEPLRPRDISFLFKGVSNVNVKVVRKLLGDLVEEYGDNTLQIIEVAEGYRLCTRAEFSPWVKRFSKREKKTKLSQAALETLAILAYKQPITKAEIEEIRRVDCGGVLHTLLERGLIRILGRRDVVGRPIVYGTTPLFLEHFGFKSLSDMPKPEEFETTERLDWEPAGGQEEVLALEVETETPPANGHANGHSNGHTNGHANGHADEGAERDDAPAQAEASPSNGHTIT